MSNTYHRVEGPLKDFPDGLLWEHKRQISEEVSKVEPTKGKEQNKTTFQTCFVQDVFNFMMMNEESFVVA